MVSKAQDRWSSGLPVFRAGAPGPIAPSAVCWPCPPTPWKFLFQRPFQGREFLEQFWFVARVSLTPTILVAVPFTVLVSFTLEYPVFANWERQICPAPVPPSVR